VAAARRTHVVAGNIGGQAAGYQRQILLQRHLHPSILAARIGIGELERLVGAGQVFEHIAGNLAQQLLSGCELPFGRDHCGRPAVVRGARLLDVGDGDQSDLIAAFGLFQLTIDGGQVGLLRIEVVLRGQDIEIALRDSRHQILLRGLIVRLRLRHLRIRALQRHPVLPAE